MRPFRANTYRLCAALMSTDSHRVEAWLALARYYQLLCENSLDENQAMKYAKQGLVFVDKAATINKSHAEVHMVKGTDLTICLYHNCELSYAHMTCVANERYRYHSTLHTHSVWYIWDIDWFTSGVLAFATPRYASACAGQPARSQCSLSGGVQHLTRFLNVPGAGELLHCREQTHRSAGSCQGRTAAHASQPSRYHGIHDNWSTYCHVYILMLSISMAILTWPLYCCLFANGCRYTWAFICIMLHVLIAVTCQDMILQF